MEPNGLTLSRDEFNAHALRSVMDATAQPGETARDAQTRCAAIVEIFRTFEAADAMEAMIACHCIALRFMLDAAMRDASAANLELGLLIRLRASAMAIGKNLHLWMVNFARLHARNEARAAEAQQRASQPGTAATPQSVAKQQPRARTEQSRPIAAQSPLPPVASAGRLDPSSRSALRLPDPPAPSMKQALMASVAVSQGAALNGRLTTTTPQRST